MKSLPSGFSFYRANIPTHTHTYTHTSRQNDRSIRYIDFYNNIRLVAVKAINLNNTFPSSVLLKDVNVGTLFEIILFNLLSPL